MWYKFKDEAGEQLVFDFYKDTGEWIGPFHYITDDDSENALKTLYNKKLIYKITGEFNGN